MFDSIFHDAKDLFKEDKKKVSLVNETALPKVQQNLVKHFGPAKKSELFTHATTESYLVKFWLLNDGTPIFVDDIHYSTAYDAGSDIDELIVSGAIRIASTENKTMYIDFEKQPTIEQIKWLQKLCDLHNTKTVVLEHIGTTFNIKSSKELPAILTGKVKQKSLAAQFHESVDEAVATKIRTNPMALTPLQAEIKGREQISFDIPNSLWTGAGEDQFLKFLILNDGSVVVVPAWHAATIAGKDWKKLKAVRFTSQEDEAYELQRLFLRSGGIRGRIVPNESISLDTGGTLNPKQIKSVMTLINKYKLYSVSIDLSLVQGGYATVDVTDTNRLKMALEDGPEFLNQPAYESEIQEANLSQLKKKQQSITRLFPDFYSNPKKVPGVAAKGGIRLHNMEKDKWEFRIHSATEDDLWYDAVVKWKNVGPDLERLVADRRNWNKKLNKVDLKKLAAKMFSNGDIELSCSCPAQLYWGGDYILSQDKYRAKYGEPENRSPDIRNPKKYGAYCKHLQNLMKVLPFYKGTMANWIKKFYNDVIEKAERKAKETAARFKAAGIALGKKKVESITEETAKGRDLGKSGFVFPDGRIFENDPRKEHADYVDDDASFLELQALEYRIYPAWVYDNKATIVVRTRGILTKEQVIAVNKLINGWHEPIQCMIVQRLNPPYMEGSIEPIDDNWPEELRSILAMGRNVRSLAAQFHESKKQLLETAGVVFSDGRSEILSTGEVHRKYFEKTALQFRTYGETDLVLNLYEEPTTKQMIQLKNILKEEGFKPKRIEIEMIFPEVKKLAKGYKWSDTDYQTAYELIEPVPWTWTVLVRQKYQKECQKAANESIQESDELPELQQGFKAKFPPATQKQLMTKSTFPGEHVVKLWILNDGTILWVKCAHFDILLPHTYGYGVAKNTGMIRVSSDIDKGELHLDFNQKPTQQQIIALQEIAKLHDSTSLWIDRTGDSIPLRSSSDLSAYLRGEEVHAPSLAAQFHESLQEEKLATYVVYVSKEYFPKEMWPKEIGHVSHLGMWKIKAPIGKRSEAAKIAWEQHKDEILSHIQPWIKKISLNVSSEYEGKYPKKNCYAGRMEPITVWQKGT